MEALKYTNKASCGLDEAQKKVWNDVFLNLKSDKSDIPSELHHLDRGGMTFPKSSFMPFMIKADLLYKEHTCEENFQRYGQKVDEVTKTQLLYNVELEGEFFRCIHPEETASNIKVTSEDIQRQMYEFWIQKYSNTRIKDTFLVAANKLELAKSNKITCDSQNLRDGLKTAHVAKCKSTKT